MLSGDGKKKKKKKKEEEEKKTFYLRHPMEASVTPDNSFVIPIQFKNIYDIKVVMNVVMLVIIIENTENNSFYASSI